MTAGTMLLEAGAFVGVSLDSSLFPRNWIRRAIELILDRHRRMLFLFADDLLRYTRTAAVVGTQVVLRIGDTSSLVDRRRWEFEKFIQSEIRRLDQEIQERILIRKWSSFADSRYVDLLRNLQIAYATIDSFRQSVDKSAALHVSKVAANVAPEKLLRASAGFLLDEVAMSLRITEIDAFSFEYYPDDQIAILAELYDDKFIRWGLSVEALTNRSTRSRHFEMLRIGTMKDGEE